MGKFIDLTNQRFGKLLVKERGENKYGKTAWICTCDCGKECHITSNDLRMGKRTSCGCQTSERAKQMGQNNLINITGNQYGLLTVIKPTEKRALKGEVIWECLCECGELAYATKPSLDKGDIKSCGCFRKMVNQKDLLGQKFNKLTVVDKEFRPTEIPHVLWKCKCDCGNIITVKPKNLLSGSTQSCGCLQSKGEQKIINILLENNIKFETQKTFKNCYFPDTLANAKFDFFLPDFNILIEYDGIQHYEENFGWNTHESFTQLQKRDNFKTEWCKENNILLIRIPYYDYEKITKGYIKEKINESFSFGHE